MIGIRGLVLHLRELGVIKGGADPGDQFLVRWDYVEHVTGRTIRGYRSRDWNVRIVQNEVGVPRGKNARGGYVEEVV